MRKIVLEHFAKYTEKHLWQETPLFWIRCFPVNFTKFLRTAFLRNTSGRLLLLRT